VPNLNPKVSPLLDSKSNIDKHGLHCKPRINTASRRDLKAISRIDYEFLPKNSAWTLEEYRRDFDASGNLYLVARCNNSVVGYLTATLELDTAWVLGVAVLPDHRRLGLANRLLKATELWAEDQSAADMLIQVEYGNLSAAHFYKKSGFELTGDLKNYHGPGLHAHEMRKTVQ